MDVPFLNLMRQYASIQEELEDSVLKVMRSGSYIGGEYVEEFENNMRDYLGVRHVVSCSNGTDALVMALRAHKIGFGDEVITTPFTFFATAEAIASVGAVPVFVDIDNDDFCIDTTKIEERITKKTKAIMPVHIFGWPCDMYEIHNIAQAYKLAVIEDAAQAIGSEYRGKKIGVTPDIACFSFYPTKNLGAFGDGGMVTTDDDDLAIVLRSLREHGVARNGAKAREILYGAKVDNSCGTLSGALYDPYRYFNYIIAYSARFDAMQAAILNTKLKYLDAYNAMRAIIADTYTKTLSQYIKTPISPKYGKSCYHQYAVRCGKKYEFADYLASRGIGTGAFYPVPLHLQTAFEYLGYMRGSLPVAEALTNETVCLPIFPELTKEEIEHVIRAVIDYVRVAA